MIGCLRCQCFLYLEFKFNEKLRRDKSTWSQLKKKYESILVEGLEDLCPSLRIV